MGWRLSSSSQCRAGCWQGELRIGDSKNRSGMGEHFISGHVGAPASLSVPALTVSTAFQSPLASDTINVIGFGEAHFKSRAHADDMIQCSALTT